VTFTAQAVGLAGVQYQWQFNGVNIPGATNLAAVKAISAGWNHSVAALSNGTEKGRKGVGS
jgi:hypothetical protein